MAGAVHIPWYATGFRGDQLQAELERISPLSVRYGATGYAVYRGRDDRYKLLQILDFDDHADWERWWNGPEMVDFRDLLPGLVPGPDRLRLERPGLRGLGAEPRRASRTSTRPPRALRPARAGPSSGPPRAARPSSARRARGGRSRRSRARRCGCARAKAQPRSKLTPGITRASVARDALEGVVVVVEDDHVPAAVVAAAGPARRGAARRSRSLPRGLPLGPVADEPGVGLIGRRAERVRR